MLENAAVNEFENMSDEELAMLAKHDTVAAEYLITKYKGLIKSCTKAFYVVGAEKEDLIQESMIYFLKAINSFKPGNISFYSFARMCIRRGMISVIKTSNRYKNLPLNYSISLDKYFFEDSAMTLLDVLSPKHGDDPLDQIIGDEELYELEQEIFKEMTPLEKKVYNLYITGIKYNEISKKLGVTYKSVDSAITRIRRKVLKAINKLSYDEINNKSIS